ncbi:TonB-dependent receptor [Candidatus Competibacter denitrificans Run_A_D11]|uniref:TonB-dependent receptor n=1 Tax=Candidatus Competibacter denitrificans Run_A_D11 TaxID=1400863 RepID=W6M4W8_9GAMM|nr:TonB-dependent receptor [Candidatus Competibacter denitrificans]CDI02787.1 TonB-dependent receptor [Candidatus Competibacter denitrificans Run_A_D11]HRC69450.1 TonB-dependent receptor [Candidatus Competibacter denitrificans]
MKPHRLALILTALPLAVHAEETRVDAEETRLDEISITATREERASGEVPQAIAVVGKAELEDKKMFNVKEALQAIPGVFVDSKNGGFDARLIIRGAGLKAPYGIREIMVLRDGVPLTDPDSFSRLDFVDTQDIERIEVAKGPGNLFAAGSSGGAIQIFSKSVFDDAANNLKLGFGTQGTQNYHLRYGLTGERQAVALTATYRNMDNDWRIWNQFDTTQISLKHGLLLDGGSLESELSYAEANIQLPGAMDKTLYEQFVDKGKQTDTSEAWKHSGRYSKVLFLNSKYEVESGDFTFKPRLYYNTWYHYHPVTGIVNESEEWVWNLGADLEGQWKHSGGTLVGGLTARQERTPDSRKYQYGQVKTTTSRGACVDSATATGRILATCSDAKGRLAEIDDATNLLTGIYLQESWRPAERWIVDIGVRYDLINFTDDNQQFWKYDYAAGKYIKGAGPSHSEKTYRLPAPKLAVNYKLTDTLNLFGMIAQAGQVPSQSEFSNNPALEAPISRNHEIGLKGRSKDWRFDASVYVNNVEKEIVTITTGGVNNFVNAGETERKGLELAGSLNLAGGFELGGYYGYADYTYESFSEPVGGKNLDRAGNTVPFVPKNQYGVFLGWASPTGWKARLSSNTWGSYWLDNANTEKYAGWDWVTNFSLSYEQKGHSVTLNADNLFDQHYAMEVKKDTIGKVTYAAAAPRTLMLTYRYDFQ